MKDLIIIGTCGEACEIIDAVAAINRVEPTWRIVGLIDEVESKRANRFYRDVSILGNSDAIAGFDLSRSEFIVTSSSVDSFLAKGALVVQLISRYPGIRFATIIHPQAWVSPTARVGQGTYLGAGVVVDAEATVGDHCIVHFHSVISRFVRVGDCSFISAGVVITGGKEVGCNTYIGVKSTVHGNLGDNVLVSAGTIVKKDVIANSIVSNNIALDVVTFDGPEDLQEVLSELPQ